MKSYNTVLTIAGSDSGGGAGIQADIKTISSLNCYALSVLTSLTAQNTKGVQSIFPVTPGFIKEQLTSIFSDFEIKAIKIGMLHNCEVIKTIYDTLVDFKDIPIVFDPVMVATSGDLLLEKDAIDSLKTLIIPISKVITPNLFEAQELIGSKIETIEDFKNACLILSKMGIKNILIKGGDSKMNDSIDVLYEKEKNSFRLYQSPKIKTINLHGTGCTFSSAIASFLSMGIELDESIEKAKNYINNAIKSGSTFKLGKGNGPVNHMWQSLN